jgi:hypothetical protein
MMRAPTAEGRVVLAMHRVSKHKWLLPKAYRTALTAFVRSAFPGCGQTRVDQIEQRWFPHCPMVGMLAGSPPFSADTPQYRGLVFEMQRPKPKHPAPIELLLLKIELNKWRY